jgi:hypothetical protein
MHLFIYIKLMLNFWNHINLMLSQLNCYLIVKSCKKVSEISFKIIIDIMSSLKMNHKS